MAIPPRRAQCVRPATHAWTAGCIISRRRVSHRSQALTARVGRLLPPARVACRQTAPAGECIGEGTQPIGLCWRRRGAPLSG